MQHVTAIWRTQKKEQRILVISQSKQSLWKTTYAKTYINQKILYYSKVLIGYL